MYQCVRKRADRLRFRIFFVCLVVSSYFVAAFMTMFSRQIFGVAFIRLFPLSFDCERMVYPPFFTF